MARPLAEKTPRLDVGELLRASRAGALAWPGDPEPVRYEVDLERRRLVVGGAPIALTSTPGGFGGATWYAVCPNCEARARVLYGWPLACRACAGLAYLSQRTAPRARALLREQRLRLAVGGAGHLMGAFPPRPKGMRLRAYLRREALAAVASARWLAGQGPEGGDEGDELVPADGARAALLGLGSDLTAGERAMLGLPVRPPRRAVPYARVPYPRRDPSSPASCTLRFRCTPREREAIVAAAVRAGVDVSTFIRQRALGLAPAEAGERCEAGGRVKR